MSTRVPIFWTRSSSTKYKLEEYFATKSVHHYNCSKSEVPEANLAFVPPPEEEGKRGDDLGVGVRAQLDARILVLQGREFQS